MFHEILKKRTKELGYTIKYVSQESRVPERTVTRIYSGETPSPNVDTLYAIAVVLGLTLEEILTGNNSVLGGKDYKIILEEYTELTYNVEKLKSEITLVLAENSVLKDKIAVLTAENELLKVKLEHKEEIISLHNYYINLNRKE